MIITDQNNDIGKQTVHSTATKYWCCHTYYCTMLFFLTSVSVAIIIQQVLPKKRGTSNSFNMLW